MKEKLVSLSAYSEKSLVKYGKYTLDNRAIPDFRDGLKPVHRRILYSAHQMGLSDYKGLLKKSARLVGDVLGKYHPHGDLAVYSSIVGMVQSLNPLIFGSGNWGTLIDGAAAMRYTECRLTRYSDKVFFDPDYKNCIDYVSNFDGSEKEPVILPSLLPNILLNGSFGIATGGRCSIPSYETKGVVKLVRISLKRKVTIKDCMKYLVPECPEGAIPDLTRKKALETFYETGEGTLHWKPSVEEFLKERTIRIDGFAPTTSSSLITLLKKLGNDDRVANIEDESDIVDDKTHLKYAITIKRSIPKDSVEEVLDDIASKFESNQSLMFSVTERMPKGDETDVEFSYINMPDFFAKWTEWRVAIEIKSLKFKLGKEEEKKKYNTILLWACRNKEKIVAALNTNDPVKKLASYGEITKEDAQIILELRLRQIQKLEMEKISKNINDAKESIKTLKDKILNPNQSVDDQIKEVMQL